MGNQQNSIVLNGKLYDAVTGSLIHEPAAKPQAHQPKIHRKKTGLVMDGVVHKAPKVHKAKKVHAQPKAHNTASQHAAAKPVRNHTAAHAQRHKPQRAATLMRQSVRKPAHAQHHKAEKPAHIHDERTSKRLERAQAVQKSQHIQRFPQHNATHQPAAKKAAPAKVAPVHKTVHQTAHQTHAAPAHPPAPVSESERLVTNALKHARAHEANQPFAKKPKKRLAHKLGFKRRTANMAMGALAALLLVGFFVYQNIPNLSMRLASNRAGFNAQLPDYQPSGFSQDNLVTYSPGKVSVSFHSNSDDRRFNLTQQVSNWNSEALADNYLAANDKPYQTYQEQGKTIYIYDNSSATWVNGGVWYQIEGKSSLTSDQLLKIASSI